MTTAGCISFSLAVILNIEAGCAAVTITEGSTVMFTFDLADVSPIPSSLEPSTRVGFYFIGLLPSESFEFKVFDEQGDLDPTFAVTYTGGTGNTFYDFSPGVTDLDGSFTVTMISGSASLAEYFVAINSSDGIFYSKKFPNIPEPSPSILGLLGFVMLTHRRVRTRRDTATVSASLAGW